VPDGPAPESGLRRRADSFKVSKRRELDISIVSAAFVFDTDADEAPSPRLAFGGVAATPARPASDGDLLRAGAGEADPRRGAAILRDVFAAQRRARRGRYRRGLIVSLWEKFVDGASRASTAIRPVRRRRGARRDADDPSRALRTRAPAATSPAGPLRRRPAESRVDARGVAGAPRTPTPASCGCDVTRAQGDARRAGGAHREDFPGINDIGAIRHDEPIWSPTARRVVPRAAVALVVADSSSRPAPPRRPWRSSTMPCRR
jgi:xanthine dehydrogenase large subunit